MLKYKNNNYYFQYSELTFEKKQAYYNEIKNFVRKIAWEYCDFWTWYDKLFSSDVELNQTREIIICQSHFQIAGIAILKKDSEEQKICTLRVAKEFQHQGIGKELMEQSIEWLENEKPLITVHKSKSSEFQSLFDRYGFVLEEKQRNYYHLFSTEFVYNGILPEKKFVLNQMEIFDLENTIKNFLVSGQKDFNLFLDNCIQQWWKREQIRNRIINEC